MSVKTDAYIVVRVPEDIVYGLIAAYVAEEFKVPASMVETEWIEHNSFNKEYKVPLKGLKQLETKEFKESLDDFCKKLLKGEELLEGENA